MQADDDASDTSSDLPPALITASDYESFVCGACASRSELLKTWAGTPGIVMVVRDSPEKLWKCLEADRAELTNENVTEISESSEIGMKRPRPGGADGPQPKRPRVPSTLANMCLAMPVNAVAQKIFADLSTAKSPCLGTGDLFLKEGFRDRWCRCKTVSKLTTNGDDCDANGGSKCAVLLNDYPYLLEEEETYEPPQDPDSGKLSFH
jgi:E3 ubiquitin-protein ligase UBR7